MLTEAQKESLKTKVRTFLESLTSEQCRAFYFRLDDILQYDRGVVELFYYEAGKFI